MTAPKILLVGAGAGVSTKDVELGYYEAFQILGVQLYYYWLDKRLFIAKKWMDYLWKHLYNKDELKRPSWDEVVYRGGIEALEMALRYDVDWVFVISAMYLHPDVIIMMKRAGLKVAVLLTESPYLDLQQSKVAALVDVVFTNERTSIHFLKNFCRRTYYIRHAYSRARHWVSASEVTDPVHDVVFVGTGFIERIDILSSVNWKGINLGLYGHWGLLPTRHHLRKHIKGRFLNNQETHSLYRNSLIGLNLYRTSVDYDKESDKVTSAESLNPRAYELAASGTFSITEFRLEAREVLGTSQPYILDPKELEDCIRSFLGAAGGRRHAAQTAQELVEGHTFIDRAQEILWHLSNTTESVASSTSQRVEPLPLLQSVPSEVSLLT